MAEKGLPPPPQIWYRRAHNKLAPSLFALPWHSGKPIKPVLKHRRGDNWSGPLAEGRNVTVVFTHRTLQHINLESSSLESEFSTSNLFHGHSTEHSKLIS